MKSIDASARAWSAGPIRVSGARSKAAGTASRLGMSIGCGAPCTSSKPCTRWISSKPGLCNASGIHLRVAVATRSPQCRGKSRGWRGGWGYGKCRSAGCGASAWGRVVLAGQKLLQLLGGGANFTALDRIRFERLAVVERPLATGLIATGGSQPSVASTGYDSAGRERFSGTAFIGTSSNRSSAWAMTLTADPRTFFPARSGRWHRIP